MTKDIRDSLLEWLRKTGYPFQLHAGRAIQTAGWHVNYSRWYRDRTTEAYREVDLQAIVGGVRPGASLFVCLCIECKSSEKTPWIGLSSRLNGGNRSLVASAPGLMTRRFAHAAQVLELTLPELLPRDTAHVDSVVAGFTQEDASEIGNRDHKKPRAKERADPTSPHSALLQAVAAATAYDKEFLATAIVSRPELATATMVFPMVLLRGRLFVYRVQEGRREELDEVGAVIASVPTDNEDNSTLVPLLTEDHARALWAPMHSSCHNFCVAGLPDASRLAYALTLSEREMTEQL